MSKFRCDVSSDDYLRIIAHHQDSIDLKIVSPGFGGIAITSQQSLNNLIRKLEKAGRKAFGGNNEEENS